MYFKSVWGFGGTDEQKELQKEQLKNILEELGAVVTMEDTELKGEKVFVINVKKINKT